MSERHGAAGRGGGGGSGGEAKPQDGGRGGGEEEELSVRVSPLLIMFFVLCMCSMLVLLYFFFDQLGNSGFLSTPYMLPCTFHFFTHKLFLFVVSPPPWFFSLLIFQVLRQMLRPIFPPPVRTCFTMHVDFWVMANNQSKIFTLSSTCFKS